jgi:DnaK suppressor protein
MSDQESVELTPEQIVELRAQLVTTLEEVERSLSTSTQDAKPVDLDLSIGRLSRVDALQQQHMAMARRERTEIQLQQIRSALARIDAGTYGACVACEEPIGYGRLKARPESLCCRDCQQAQR